VQTKSFLWFRSDRVMESHGPLPKGAIVRSSAITIGGALHENDFLVPDEALGRYGWPAAFSRFVNDLGLDIRAGERQGDDIVVIAGSYYRNQLWMLLGKASANRFSIRMPAGVLADAEASYSQTVERSKGDVPLRAQVDGWLAVLGADGRFSDLPYPPVERIPEDKLGPLVEHISRIQSMACYAYVHRVESDVEPIVKGVVAAIGHIVATRYTPINWWHNAIGFAKMLGSSFVCVAGFASARSLVDTYVPYAREQTPLDATNIDGANLADYCAVQIRWTLAAWRQSGDGFWLSMLMEASGRLSKLAMPVSRPASGIHGDGSFTQHNKASAMQLSTCAYGIELIKRLVEAMLCLEGVFALSREAMRSLEWFLLHGAYFTFYDRAVDFHPLGRGMARGSGAANMWQGTVETSLSHDPVDAQGLQALLMRIKDGENEPTVRTQAFWKTDYLVYHGPRTGGGCKMCTLRSIGSESGNGDNKRAYYMGFGTTFVLTRGRGGAEYRDIQPVWDWQRLPGTTVEQVPGFSYPAIEWGSGSVGSDRFGGALADQSIGAGVNAMVLTRRNVKHAKKSVVAIDDMYFFMGSSIDIASATHPVRTSVEQCLYDTNDRVNVERRGGESSDIGYPGEIVGSDIVAITVGTDRRYCFAPLPEGDVIGVRIADQQGAWSEIGNGSGERITRAVLSIDLRHAGGRPASYSYTVGSPEGSRHTGTVKPGLHLLSILDMKVAGVAFDVSTESIDLIGGASIRPLQPCGFIATAGSGFIHLTCADLSQQRTVLEFDICLGSGQEITTHAVVMPGGEDAGRSVTVEFK
jgi:chondroitin AC lyase